MSKEEYNITLMGWQSSLQLVMPGKEKVGSSDYVAFFFSWNHVATKGKEKPRDAPPIRTKNRRTLFFVWKGIFCVCVCAHILYE